MNRHERIDHIREPYCLPYDKAIDLAFKLNHDDPEWHYRVDIDATSGLAKIAVLENDELLGYL